MSITGSEDHNGGINHGDYAEVGGLVCMCIFILCCMYKIHQFKTLECNFILKALNLCSKILFVHRNHNH